MGTQTTYTQSHSAQSEPRRPGQGDVIEGDYRRED
jgi:hypothetical protein